MMKCLDSILAASLLLGSFFFRSINSFSPAQCKVLPAVTTSRIHGNVAFRSSENVGQSRFPLFAVGGKDKTGSDSEVWSPELRRIMSSVATLGSLETAYLTYNKIVGAESPFCGVDGDCNSVLTGPYASLPFFPNIPLASIGFLAYASVAILAVWPLLGKPSDDTNNRIFLTAATTAMGTFSVFLMTLLFNVLHTTCVFCIVSAVLSLSLAGISWFGGSLPESNLVTEETEVPPRVRGAKLSAMSFLATTVAALVLFVSVGDSNAASGNSSAPTQLFSPPSITTDSSSRALQLAKQLEQLDTRMYGAYWCSHCFDQKQSLGKQVFSEYVPYVECAKDGVDSQSKLCREKKVPGYPTWEIAGELYPGEQAIEELEEAVQKAMASKSTKI